MAQRKQNQGQQAADPYKQAAEQAQAQQAAQNGQDDQAPATEEQVNAQAQEQAQQAADSAAESTGSKRDQVTNLSRNRWAKGDLIVPAKGTVTLTKRQKENSQLMRRVARAMEIGVLKRG